MYFAHGLDNLGHFLYYNARLPRKHNTFFLLSPFFFRSRNQKIFYNGRRLNKAYELVAIRLVVSGRRWRDGSSASSYTSIRIERVLFGRITGRPTWWQEKNSGPISFVVAVFFFPKI